jgi:hypothetical protein
MTTPQVNRVVNGPEWSQCRGQACVTQSIYCSKGALVEGGPSWRQALVDDARPDFLFGEIQQAGKDDEKDHDL